MLGAVAQQVSADLVQTLQLKSVLVLHGILNVWLRGVPFSLVLVRLCFILCLPQLGFY